jgi:hypothetical protein
MIVAWGDIIMFDFSSSKYLVIPAPEEGKFILLSLAIPEENHTMFKKIVENTFHNNIYNFPCIHCKMEANKMNKTTLALIVSTAILSTTALTSCMSTYYTRCDAYSAVIGQNSNDKIHKNIIVESTPSKNYRPQSPTIDDTF